MRTGTTRGHARVALLFLAPNLLGFLAFTLVPVVASFVGSFTTWSLRLGGTLQFVGLENYRELLFDKAFYFYLFNTAYLMLALPFSIGGALLLAIVLHGKFSFRTDRRQRWLAGLALGMAAASAALAASAGARDLAFVLAALGVLGAIGLVCGSVAYRTMFYLPHFTAGAATVLLWTQLYNPHYGVINQTLSAVAEFTGWKVDPPGWLTSTRSLLGFLPLPEHFNNGGFGVGAREALMLMAVWAGIGGNNLILYLAGLSNIPTDLYDAADIDGAGTWQRFRYVTWPQLAPTTFFIVIMSVIGGLQGGFEQARLMTQGGPAGVTTTISYYIYQLGFERLDFGYGCAVAWALFAMIFALTLLNWRYGKQAAE